MAGGDYHGYLFGPCNSHQQDPGQHFFGLNTLFSDETATRSITTTTVIHHHGAIPTGGKLHRDSSSQPHQVCDDAVPASSKQVLAI